MSLKSVLILFDTVRLNMIGRAELQMPMRLCICVGLLACLSFCQQDRATFVEENCLEIF